MKRCSNNAFENIDVTDFWHYEQPQYKNLRSFGDWICLPFVT